MKTKFFSLILIQVLFLFVNSLYSQPGWNRISQNVTAQDLNEVKFLNSQTGWACGGTGAVIRTVNGGATWSVVPTGSSAYFNAVQFVNALTGWIAADVNNFKKTTDGGDTWVNQVVSGTGILNRCYALTDQICFAAGAQGKLYRTIDGGTTWTVIHSANSDYNRFSFINNQTGWISGTNYVMKTTNCGDTWTQFSLTGPNRDLSFITANTGWVVSYPNVRRTTDGGDTWQTFAVADSGNVFDGVRFLNSQTGYIIGSSNYYYKGRIYKTVNGGATWTKQKAYPSFGFYGLEFTNTLTGYAVGNGGMVYKTTTGGELYASNWIYARTASTMQDLNEVRFLNPLTGWACGGNGALIKSIDGGANWTAVPTGSTAYFNAVHFVNANTGWIAADVNNFKKTTDGGATWINQSVDGTGIINRCYALSAQICFAAGIDGKLHRTGDGGNTWQVVKTASSDFNRFCFINSQTGWVTGQDNLYKTTDAGLTWVQSSVPGSNRDISFINENTGWIPNFPDVIKTTDGGATWNSYYVTAQPGSVFFGIRFVSEQVGYCIGVDYNNGKIFRTLDGGATWAEQVIPSVNGIYGLHFYDEMTGWAVGSRGNTFRTIDGGFTFVGQTSAQVPERFALKQNYPNPFNPSTKINFDIKNSSFASLKIYDIRGREVRTLINENLSAGTYEVNFNATELNSGVYFYTLKTNDFSETRKMILVK
ncbi:MAG: T9SS type A sorting domain-containing protein [Bacteroidetes bacterium]|nr:T9SS type A sorting domain-containing protein [Bacteroidota bacterium]